MRKSYLLICVIGIACILAGCVNGRIWGDNFLRGWFNDVQWRNNVKEKKIVSTTISGISGGYIPQIVMATSIPFVLLIIISDMRKKRSMKSAISLLITLIEKCDTIEEIKRLSALFSGIDHIYKGLVDKELKKLKL